MLKELYEELKEQDKKDREEMLEAKIKERLNKNVEDYYNSLTVAVENIKNKMYSTVDLKDIDNINKRLIIKNRGENE